MLEYLFSDAPAAGEVYEICPGVLWLRMPLPMALDHINLYLLEDEDGWWIIDTGIALAPTQELWEGVFERVLGDKPVKAVLSTHYHPDHIGMAGWLCDYWRAPFYMTQAEYLSGLAFSRTGREHYSWALEEYRHRIGYPDDLLVEAREDFGGFASVITPMPVVYRRLVDGASLTIKGFRWQVIIGRGHSPEHACLYCSERNILLSGDQVIPRITPNISVSEAEPESNPLQEWFHSLERLLGAVPADALVLPAHNTPFYGLHERLRYLIEHHEDHLLALEDACRDREQGSLDLLPELFQRKLSGHNLQMALGECQAHLNYLLQRGRMRQTLGEDGRYRYRTLHGSRPAGQRKRAHHVKDDTPIQV